METDVIMKEMESKKLSAETVDLHHGDLNVQVGEMAIVWTTNSGRGLLFFL